MLVVIAFVYKILYKSIAQYFFHLNFSWFFIATFLWEGIQNFVPTYLSFPILVFTDKVMGFWNFKRHCITKVLTDDYRMILCFDKKQSKLIIDSYTILNFISAGFNFVSAEGFFLIWKSFCSKHVLHMDDAVQLKSAFLSEKKCRDTCACYFNDIYTKTRYSTLHFKIGTPHRRDA